MTAILTPEDIVFAWLDRSELRALIDQRTPAQGLLRWAVRHAESDLRVLAAQRLSADPEVMAFAADDSVAEVREVAARSTATPVEVLTALMCDRSVACRMALATNRALALEQLATLSDDESVGVRRVLAEEAPVALLARLAHDTSTLVRCAVAQRQDLPDEVARILADDWEIPVRQELARRAGPGDVLEYLARDDRPEVQVIVATNISVPLRVHGPLVASRFADVRRRMAGIGHLAEELSWCLAMDPDHRVRRDLAQRTQFVEVLRQLADDRILGVRLAVADNPRTPDDVLHQFQASKSPRLRAQASRWTAVTSSE